MIEVSLVTQLPYSHPSDSWVRWKTPGLNGLGGRGAGCLTRVTRHHTIRMTTITVVVFMIFIALSLLSWMSWMFYQKSMDTIAANTAAKWFVPDLAEVNGMPQV